MGTHFELGGKGVSGAAQVPEVKLTFFLPSEELAPYITTYYHMEIPEPTGSKVVDYLHPEWANIRLGFECDIEGDVGQNGMRRVPSYFAAGPTSLSTQFSFSRGSCWGIGLLPLGWLKFVDASAHQYADDFHDISDDPAFDRFAPLHKRLAKSNDALDAQAKIIDQHLAGVAGRELRDEESVTSVHAALVDANVSTVAEFADKAAMTPRTLERFSRKAFGFTPKLLLRRQRFLRSLAQFMLDPSLSWFSTLDYHYHDQSHFVRDFKRFMTMTPNEYRNVPHPILMAAAKARAEAAGEAMQALHDPKSGG